MKIDLEVEEINTLLTILGDMPNKTGMYPLMMKIKAQGDESLAKLEESEDA